MSVSTTRMPHSHTPQSLTTALMAAWNRKDREALRALIHPDTELETPMTPLVGPTQGREQAVKLLLEMRASTIYTVEVDRVEETSATKGTVYGRSRRPAPNGGFADGRITWHIELLDGMLWRSRIV
jgi:ketosteroid isomerase-like protein